MKTIWKGAAYSCAAVMGATVGGFGAGWCSWISHDIARMRVRAVRVSA